MCIVSAVIDHQAVESAIRANISTKLIFCVNKLHWSAACMYATENMCLLRAVELGWKLDGDIFGAMVKYDEFLATGTGCALDRLLAMATRLHMLVTQWCHSILVL